MKKGRKKKKNENEEAQASTQRTKKKEKNIKDIKKENNQKKYLTSSKFSKSPDLVAPISATIVSTK
jgi:cell shape-determining protein MreC